MLAEGGDWDKVNALPFLMYYDIFKYYFANKQEENAYYVGGLSKIADSVSIIQSDGKTNTYNLNGITWVTFNTPLSQTLQMRVNNLNNQITPKQFWDTLEIRLGNNTVFISRQASSQTSDASKTTITLNKAEKGTFDSITGLRQSKEWDFEGVQMLPFALENIDKMRDKILQTPGNNT